MKSAVKTLACFLLARNDWDIRAARRRLDMIGARHSEISAVLSIDDASYGPSGRLLDLAIAVISRARNFKVEELGSRKAPSYVHVWPGTHYRLLGALVEELQPQSVVEIGTYTGLSALSMLQALPPHGQLTTVDVVPWNEIPNTCLRDSDFSDRRLNQMICNLAEPTVAREHADLLRNADLFFIDAAKDSVFERKLLENLTSIGLKRGCLLVFDDIRLWRMLDVWREIPHPKLDFTSFGNFAGTGLVEWNGG